MDSRIDILTYKLSSFSARAEGSVIKALIVHCMGIPNIVDVFDTFVQYGVSAHYLIPQVTAKELKQLMPDAFSDQTISFPDQVPAIRMVLDEDKAYHAGISCFGDLNKLPGCEKGLNECTIGIEFHSPGYAKGDGSELYHFGAFTAPQIHTGTLLMQHLARQWQLDPRNIFAHSTVSPGRKTDPGTTFPWAELYGQGLGYMPTPVEYNAEEPIKFVQERLYNIGFVTCPINGQLDELTQNNIDAYIMQYAPYLWLHKANDISQDLINSIAGFAASSS